MHVHSMECNPPVTQKSNSDKAKTRLEIGDNLLKRSKDEKNAQKKQLLLKQATNNYEQVYRSIQVSPNLHDIARIKLEKIYAYHPDLKTESMSKLFNQEYGRLLQAEDERLFQAELQAASLPKKPVDIPNLKTLLEKADDNLLRRLEKIYDQNPDLKLIGLANLFEFKEDIYKSMMMTPFKRSVIQNLFSDENNVDTYFSSQENHKTFSGRVFGNDIARVHEEQLAKERADKLVKEKEAAEKRAQELAAKQAKEKEAAERAKAQQIEKNRIAQKTASTAKKTKLKAKKAKNNFSIDEELLGIIDVQIKNRQFNEAAQTCWTTVLKSDNEKIIDDAFKKLESLHNSKKSIDATYYLVPLVKGSEKKIELFLQAENQRNLKEEQEKAKSLRAQIASIQKINAIYDANFITETPAMIEAQAEMLKFAKEGNKQALHALILHNMNQAKVFPEIKIAALRSIGACCKQLYDTKQPFPDNYNYATVLNDLGAALYESALQTIDSNKLHVPLNSTLMDAIKSDIQEAESLLNSSQELGNLESIGNLAKIMEVRFKQFQEMTLDETMALYAEALKNKSSNIVTNVESLLVEGINNFPLPLFQREKCMQALKEYNPDSALFLANNFNESIYNTAAQKNKSKENLAFYQGLYWLDKGDDKQSASFMQEALKKNHSPASLFNNYIALREKITTGKTQDALKKIKDYWKLILKSEFPYGLLLQSFTANSLKQLVDNNIAKNNGNADMIDILDTYFQGINSGCFSKHPSAINAVCGLLDQAEQDLTKNSNDLSEKNKSFDDIFISNLLIFSKLFQSTKPLYAAAGYAIAQLKQSSNKEQRTCAIKLLIEITKVLNDNLLHPDYVAIPESKAKIIEKVNQLIESGQEKEHLSSLQSLQSVLQGKPQKFETKQDGTMQEISEKFTRFYQDQTAHAGANILMKNDNEILTALRSLIEQFRKANMQKKYQLLRNKANIMTSLAEYTINKTKEYVTDSKPNVTSNDKLLSIMGLYLILMADEALITENFSLEEPFEKFCSTFPTLGPAMIAHELVTNSLFAPNKAKAREYLNLARAGAKSIVKNPQEIMLITMVEKRLNETPD